MPQLFDSFFIVNYAFFKVFLRFIGLGGELLKTVSIRISLHFSHIQDKCTHFARINQ